MLTEYKYIQHILSGWHYPIYLAYAIILITSLQVYLLWIDDYFRLSNYSYVIEVSRRRQTHVELCLRIILNIILNIALPVIF